MNTIIVYASLHGCTKKCAHMLSRLLEGKTDVINIKKNIDVDLSKYNTIIIGGSIHTGHINPSIDFFVTKHQNELIKKNLGVFLCFMDPISKGDYYFKKSFPDKIVNHVSVKGYFGGEFNFDKLTFFEKLFVKKTTNIDCSVTKIYEQQIHDFSARINNFICAN